MCTSPKNFAALRDLALDLRKRQVVAVAVGGNVAVHLVGGKVVLAAGKVHLHRAGDRAQMNVAVRRRDADSRAQPRRGHVALAGVDGHPGGFGNSHGKVDAAVVVAV